MTNKEAAELAGVSVSTLRRWQCGWCEQTMLEAMKGRCGGIFQEATAGCNPQANALRFAKKVRERRDSRK